MTVLNQAAVVLGSSRYARRTVNALLKFNITISSRLRLNPIVEIPLSPLGVDARISINLLNRDPTNILEIFANHIYDKYCRLRDGDVVVDCGAYIGEFTIQASKIVGPSGLILAFEPNPRSFNLCKSNLERNGISNVMLFQHALSDQEKDMRFKPDTSNFGGSKVVSPTELESTITVSARTLSQYFTFLGGRTIKLLKIDAEGSASNIVLGSDSLLRKKLVQYVSAEIHPGEEGLQTLLENYGFKCSRENSYLYGTSQDHQHPSPN